MSETFLLIEALAHIEHDRWSHWMEYLFSCCLVQADGSVLMPREYAEQWVGQMRTPYDALSEREKESDRAEVRKMLKVLRQGGIFLEDWRLPGPTESLA